MIPNLLEDAERYANVNPNLSDAFRMGMRCGYIEGRSIENYRMIEKACEWLRNKFEGGGYVQDYQIEEFKKAMEE